MKRAYKYRFYPTTEQAELLAQTFGCVRFVYNSILRWRTDAYYERKEKIGYLQANARLTALKKEPEYIWLNDVSCVPLQQSLRHQQAAFANFFAGRVAYPAFKSKRHKQVAEFTASAFKHRDGELYIAKASRRWMFAGVENYPLRRQPLPFPEIALAGTLFPACVSLNLYQCLLPLKRSALMWA